LNRAQVTTAHQASTSTLTAPRRDTQRRLDNAWRLLHPVQMAQ
jgi:hypothetical protein